LLDPSAALALDLGRSNSRARTESFVSGAVSREMLHDRDIREAVTPQRRLKGGAGSENGLACDETRRPAACRRVYP